MKKAIIIIFVFLLIALLALIALYAYLMWAGAANTERPNTKHGFIALKFSGLDPKKSSPTTNYDEFTNSTYVHYHRESDKAKGIIKYVSTELPANATLLTDARLIEKGFYKHGGGILGVGHYHNGLRSIAGEVLAVSSSDHSVLTVSFLEGSKTAAQCKRLRNPCSRRAIVIETISAGNAQIQLTMTKLDKNNDIVGKPINDEISITVYNTEGR